MAVQPCVDGESDRRVKRQRDAWKGGGDISGHFFQSEGFGQNEESNEKKKTRASETPAMVPAADCRFIVNVSSMEGKFYRRKLATHPVWFQKYIKFYFINTINK